MKFNVTFQCALPIDLDKHPPGEELAEYLAAELRKDGLNLHPVDNYGDFAWKLEPEGHSLRPWILVGYVGDGPFQWLATVNSGVTWFGKLLGRSDRELRERVAKKLHDVISCDERFSDIRWHVAEFSEEGWTVNPT